MTTSEVVPRESQRPKSDNPAAPRTVRHVRLVVLEHGAHWPAWLAANQNDVRPIIVVAAEEDEPPAALALRTVRRLAVVERSRFRIQDAVFAVGNDDGRQSLAARALIARSVLAHLLNAEGGDVLFTADAGVSAGTRHEVLTLVGSLMSQLGRFPVSIRVRIDP